jgi:hypothetical protein
MIDRRIFIQGTALVGSTPAFAAALLSASPSLRWSEGGADAARVVFKLHGWDRHADAASNSAMKSAPDSAYNSPHDEPVWIGVNRSWRATWR